MWRSSLAGRASLTAGAFQTFCWKSPVWCCQAPTSAAFTSSTKSAPVSEAAQIKHVSDWPKITVVDLLLLLLLLPVPLLFSFTVPVVASEEQKKALGISTPDYYHYLSQSRCYQVDGLDDASEFRDTLKAMSVMGMSEQQQAEALKLVAAIMHLGNISFVEVNNYAQVADNNYLAFPAYLLGVNDELLREKLTTRLMESRWGGKTDVTTVTLTVEQVGRAGPNSGGTSGKGD